MDPVIAAAGTALIGAIVTDAWKQARAATVRLWQRVDSEQAAAVDRELEETRSRVLAARSDDDQETEQAVVGAWRLRLQDLVRQDPALADELRRVLDEDLLPALDAAEQDRAQTILMSARASGHGRIYQAGRDQHIHE